jgi:serine/threonine protein kinase
LAKQRRIDANRIGKYEITGEIGEGGFGRVVKAWDPTIRRTVAIKLLKTGLDASLLDRFRHEAATTANLHHPNIVTLYEFGEHDGAPFIVMEYLDGKDLREVIHSGEYLPLSKKVRLLSQAAQGLQAAHEQGIFHRDIKPANIMLLQDGSAKIMDFGIARIANERATRLTKAGFQIGTLYYMAPEQFSGNDADGMTDIFSFGVTMYEFLSGQYPFGGDTDASLMYQIVNESPRPIDKLVPNCPAALMDVVAKALHRDRGQRYSSMEDLEIDLRPILIELERSEAVQLLSRIPVLLSQDKLEEAETLLRRSLLMDPANAEAKDLRERIRQRKRSGIIDAQVRDLLAQATHHEQRGALSEAFQCLEQARKLVPTDTDLGKRVEKIRQSLQSRENSVQLFQTAQRLVEQNEFQAAFERAELAVSQDPSNGPATELLSWLRERGDREQQEVAAQEQIAAAQSNAKQADYDAAISILEEAKAQFPLVPAIDSALATIRADRAEAERQRMLRVGFERVESLVASGELDEAQSSLLRILDRFPNDPTVKRKLDEITGRIAARQRKAELAAPQTEESPALRSYRAAMGRGAPPGEPGSQVPSVPPVAPHSLGPTAPTAANPAATPQTNWTDAASDAVAARGAAPVTSRRLIPIALAAAIVCFAVFWFIRGRIGMNEPAASPVTVSPETLTFNWESGNNTALRRVLRVDPHTARNGAVLRVDPPAEWVHLGELNRESGEVAIEVDVTSATAEIQETSIYVLAAASSQEALIRVPVTLHVRKSPPKLPAPAQPVELNQQSKRRTAESVTTSSGRRDVGNPSNSRPPQSSAPPPSPAPVVVAQPPTPSPEAAKKEVAAAKRVESESAGAPVPYFGSPVGSLNWNGELLPGATLILDRDHVLQGGGRLTGELPGVAVRFRRIVPGTDRLRMEESPAAPNRFSRIRLRNSSAEAINYIRIEWAVVE